MLIRHLAYLIALAKEQHFARAAQSCNISQPALSAAIRQLEDELGLPLVERDKRFIGFTPQGQEVLLWARRIIADYESLKSVGDSAKRGLTGTLRLGVIPSALSAVPMITAPLRRQHPELKVITLSASAGEIEKGLHDFELDAGILYFEEAARGVIERQIYVERYVLLVDSMHTPPEAKDITWCEAAKHNLCLLTPNMQNRRIIDGVFKTLGEMPVPVVETNSFLTSMAHVAHGGLSSIIPQIVVDLFGVPPGTHALPLKDPVVERPAALVVSNRNPLPPISLALLAISLPGATSEQN